ncbi:MAG: hypothetical protein AAGI51_04695 [Pseudomonadota bacterium]
MRPILAAALLSGAALVAACSQQTTRSDPMETVDFVNRLTVAPSFAAKPTVLGLLDEVDGRPVFTPCGSEDAFAVAQEDGWEQLERAWRVQGGLPGAPVLIELALDLEPRRLPDGSRRYHVIPSGLSRLEPNQPVCPNRPQQPLEPLRAAG